MKRWILPAVAVVLLVYAAVQALLAQRAPPDRPPPLPPSTTPFERTVAGAGMVEPATESSGTGGISVGSQTAGVVTRIAVRIGQEVKAGDLLFELDARTAEADLKARQAAVAVAGAQLRRLELQPRPEEVPPSEAQVAAAEADLKQAQDVVARDRDAGPGVISGADRVLHLETARAATARLAQARANLALLKAGAWEADKVVARAALDQARAQVAQAQTALDVLKVRAPVDGTILQVNVRPGEYVASAPGQALMLMGNLRPLHVRVNIDEEDIARLVLNAPARAKIRGDERQEVLPLRFVRLEPYIVPKTSLTGVNTERVDTRVVQVIYALDPTHPLVLDRRVLVGQLVDVFIESRPAEPAGSRE